MKIRCSILPIAMRCGGAVRGGEIEIDETDEASSLGTAVHEGMATVVHGGWPNVPALAVKHDMPEKELGVLIAQGSKAWEALKQHVPAPSTEVTVRHSNSALTLEGHIDVIGGLQGQPVTIVDWKTGRVDADYAQQIRGYMALALENTPDAPSAYGYVVWLREGEIEPVGRIGRDGIKPLISEVTEAVVNWDGVYRPGKHCTFCPRTHDCPAHRAMVRRDVAALTEVDVDALAALPVERLVELVEKASMVARRAEGVRKAARKLVEQQGDIVGGGKRLTLEVANTREVDPLKAFPLLQDPDGYAFTDAEMAQCIEVSAAKAEDVVAKRAKRGKGAEAVRALRRSLDEAGAVTAKPVTRLVVRRDT